MTLEFKTAEDFGDCCSDIEHLAIVVGNFGSSTGIELEEKVTMIIHKDGTIVLYPSGTQTKREWMHILSSRIMGIKASD